MGDGFDGRGEGWKDKRWWEIAMTGGTDMDRHEGQTPSR